MTSVSMIQRQKEKQISKPSQKKTLHQRGTFFTTSDSEYVGNQRVLESLNEHSNFEGLRYYFPLIFCVI